MCRKSNAYSPRARQQRGSFTIPRFFTSRIYGHPYANRPTRRGTAMIKEQDHDLAEAEAALFHDLRAAFGELNFCLIDALEQAAAQEPDGAAFLDIDRQSLT